MIKYIRKHRGPAALALALLLFLGLGAGSCASGNSNSADNRERATSNDTQERYANNQPIPSDGWSQLRQNLKEIEIAQIRGSSTFAYFFIEGKANGKPVMSCSSMGFPIPASFQLSNPLKPAGYQDSATIAQMEPNGVFTGDTDGTYVICLRVSPGQPDDGRPYAMYWEGRVMMSSVELQWDEASGTMVPTGATGKDAPEFTRGK